MVAVTITYWRRYLERSSVGIRRRAVALSFAGVERADELTAVRPQIHAATVSPVSVEPTVVDLSQTSASAAFLLATLRVSAVFDVARCLSVCLSVRPSVCHVSELYPYG